MNSQSREGLNEGMGRVVVCVTVDVEDSNIESLTRIKEVCREHNAPVTWFVEPRLCCEIPALNLLGDYSKQGDEVGLHLHWKDSRSLGLPNLSTEQINLELEGALKLLRPRFGVKSFRGGGLCQTASVLDILSQKGIEIDSSVAHGLNERHGWYQGHNKVHPISAYYPSRMGYDVVSHEDSERLDILEVPVTRGMPALRLWNNMLEPGITPPRMLGLVFEQYSIRRQFQPLVIMIVIFHSWSPRSKATMLSDLDGLLDHARDRNTEFETIASAGYRWKELWEHQPAVRQVLLSHEFDFDLKTRMVARLIELAIFIHNLRDAASYFAGAVKHRLLGAPPNDSDVR